MRHPWQIRPHGAGEPVLPKVYGLIYDVGAANGDDTEFYLKKGFRVIAIEANPVSAAKLRERFALYIDAASLEILNVAIATTVGACNFLVNGTHPEWSSWIQDIGSRGGVYSTIQVASDTLAAVLSRYGVPYYLKVDIEGADMVAARELKNFDVKPPYISVESGPTLEWLDGLRDIGYELFKFVDQAKVPELSLPVPAREGAEVAHSFQPGSSGPFGEETPGDWVPYERFRLWLQAYLDHETPARSLWFDIHGKWR